MIDLHCHILPNVDDGAKNIEMSLKMIDEAIKQGVTKIIATPHFNERRISDESYVIKVHHAYQELLNELKGRDIELYLGAEIKYTSNIIDYLKQDLFLTLNKTNYVLIEFPVYLSKQEIERALYHVLASGYQPILAHVERYSELNYEDVVELVKLGVLIQVNCQTICLSLFDQQRKFVFKLLKNKLVSFICSDAHNLDTRKFMNQKAARIICKKFGKDYCYQLMEGNALKIINN